MFIETEDKVLDAKLYHSGPARQLIIVSTGYGAHLNYNPLYTQFAQRASDKGHSVLLYSFTGTGESAGVFRETNIPTQIDDLSTVIAYARRKIKPKKIHLLGHSLGAGISISTFAKEKAQGTAGDIGSIIVWNSSISSHNAYDRYAEHYANPNNNAFPLAKPLTGETIISGRAMWESFKTDNPAIHLAKVDIPLLVLFGGNDPLVDSQSVRSLLNTNSTPYDWRIIPDCSHEFRDSTHREKTVAITLDWLMRHS